MMDRHTAHQHFIGLDILRGVSILLVLGRHLFDIPETLPFFIRQVLYAWREIGWIGVDCFFVLSGFLVSQLLFTEYINSQHLRAGRFLIRRGLKIYPSFYFFLLITLMTSWIFAIPKPFSSFQFLSEAFFVQNYFPSMWGHTWSLAIEEHFYLLLIVLLFILAKIGQQKNPFRSLPLIIVITATLITGLRIIKALQNPLGWWFAILPYTHLRIDSLFIGVLISYYYSFHRELLFKTSNKYNRAASLTAGFIFLLPLLFSIDESKFIISIGLTFIYLAFGYVVTRFLIFQLPSNAALSSIYQTFAYVGRKSYSIYLWHLLCYRIAVTIWPSDDLSVSAFLLRTMLYLVGSLVVGIAAAKLIETPALRFRDCHFP